MNYYDIEQAARRHQELITEAQNERREYAPLPKGETWLTRLARLFSADRPARSEKQVKMPRHA